MEIEKTQSLEGELRKCRAQIQKTQEDAEQMRKQLTGNTLIKTSEDAVAAQIREKEALEKHTANTIAELRAQIGSSEDKLNIEKGNMQALRMELQQLEG